MATLGLGVIASIALTNEVGLTGGPDGMSVPDFSILGLRVAGEKAWYWIFAAALVAAIVLAAQSRRQSRRPRAARAARLARPPPGRSASTPARSRPACSCFRRRSAAVMGSLYAHYEGFVTPGLAAFPKSVELVTMVVVGGMASIWGSVLGAALLSLAPRTARAFRRLRDARVRRGPGGDDDFPAARDRAEPGARFWRKES